MSNRAKAESESHEGSSPGVSTNEQPTGSFGLQDIEDNYLPTYTRSWEQVADVPWVFSPDTKIMISYEDLESLTSKVNYAVSNGLGGVMIWELGSDDNAGTLVNTVGLALGTS